MNIENTNAVEDVVLYDTSEVSSITKVKKDSVKTFKIVSPDSAILHTKLKEFDFNNPPVNPNEFASSLVETCKENNGLGLSANQCGFPYRVFVIGIRR